MAEKGTRKADRKMAAKAGKGAVEAVSEAGSHAVTSEAPAGKSKGKAPAKTSAKHAPKSSAPAANAPLPQTETRIMAIELGEGELSPQMQAYFEKCRDKIGYVPNVLRAYAFDNAKLEAFATFYNDLMLAPASLSKLEREMIAVAVSSVNRCFYCLTAHGAAVRQLSGDPMLGELMVMNYRAAHLSERHRAMLDFAVKLTEAPATIVEEDRARLRAAGFDDRGIWDIGAVASFFNMTNRMAAAVDMRPNAQYHADAR